MNNNRGKRAMLAPFIVAATVACAPGDEGNTVPVQDKAPAEATREAPARDEQPKTNATEEPASGTVPNVVGKNHQLAQDTMQAAGYYNLSEEDATGQGRMLIVDRNWVVVSQVPEGGAKAAEDTRIVLRSKKIGE